MFDVFRKEIEWAGRKLVLDETARGVLPLLQLGPTSEKVTQ